MDDREHVLAVLAVVVLSAVLVFKRFSSVFKEKELLAAVPGPLSLPLFGSTWLYSRWGPYTQKKYHESNDAKYRKYGSVVKEEVLFNTKIFHLFAKQDILEVLHYNSEYPLRPPNEADVYYRLNRPDIYSNVGMVNENGPTWHKLRKLLTPPITTRRTVQNYAPLMNDIAGDFVDLVGTERDVESNVVPDFRNFVYRAGLETVCGVALERRLGFLNLEMNVETQSIFDSINGYQTASNEAMYGLPWWKYLPKNFSFVFTKLVQHKDNLFQRIGEIVDESLRSGDFIGSKDQHRSSILEQLLSNKALETSDVKASVVDYITAGVDTIGNTALFAIALIAKYPKVQRKLQGQLDQLSGQELTPDLLKSAAYLDACLQESFRIYPTASQLARILEEDTLVTGGYVLSKGSVVLCHHRVAALQEENFTRPFEFIPERWTNEKDPSWTLEPGLVVPFGIGRRICPGKRLAEQEVATLVAKLFVAFDVELDGDLDADFNFLLAPSDSFQLKFIDRQY